MISVPANAIEHFFESVEVNSYRHSRYHIHEFSLKSVSFFVQSRPSSENHYSVSARHRRRRRRAIAFTWRKCATKEATSSETGLDWCFLVVPDFWQVSRLTPTPRLKLYYNFWKGISLVTKNFYGLDSNVFRQIKVLDSDFKEYWRRMICRKQC